MSELFLQALRAPHTAVVTVEAWRNGQRLDVDLTGAKGGVTIGGVGVRRKLNISLPPTPGLWDALAPVGTELWPARGIRFPDGAVEAVPQGRFVIDEQSLDHSGGGLTVTAPDRWALIQRAKFIRPQPSIPDLPVKDQIVELIRQVLGRTYPATVTATSNALMPALVWEQDRDKAILDLAASIGAEVFFDAIGTIIVRDVPSLHTPPVWLANSGPRGVLSRAERRRSRSRTYNVVICASGQVDGTEPYEPIVVWDNDPNSPTYAGPDPINRPDLAGPFGVVPYFYVSESLVDADRARRAATMLLARVTGLAAQLSLSQVVNPAVEVGDVWDVVLPRERPDLPRPVEQHIVDTATVPLDVEAGQAVDTRSNRPPEDDVVRL